MPFDVNLLKQKLRITESFDLVCRNIIIKEKHANIFFVDGLIKDDIMEKIMEFFFAITDDSLLANAETFSQNCVPYVEVNLSNNIDTLCTCILSGSIVLTVNGFDQAITIDARTYPQRENGEPEKDKVLSGSKDAFVETLIFNTALIRRRIRDPDLTVKYLCAGSTSKTDIALCYMANKVDKTLLSKITLQIVNIQTEALTMNQQSLIEAIYHYKWYNPFPKIKCSERPDTAAASVIEGGIVILVDNSPSAIILPTSIFDLLEEADDYYFPPITGTYIRMSRYFVTLATLFITPVWVLLLQNPSLTPKWLGFFTQISGPTNIPVIWQLLLLEFIIDGMRLAALNTPSSITTSLSIIGAIILSDFAVDSGWFCSEAMLYMAFVTIANYSQPSIELGYSIKFLRVTLLVFTFLFNLWGFLGGIILIFLLILTNRTISEKSYLYPLIPFDRKVLIKKILRVRSIKS